MSEVSQSRRFNPIQQNPAGGGEVKATRSVLAPQANPPAVVATKKPARVEMGPAGVASRQAAGGRPLTGSAAGGGNRNVAAPGPGKAQPQTEKTQAQTADQRTVELNASEASLCAALIDQMCSIEMIENPSHPMSTLARETLAKLRSILPTQPTAVAQAPTPPEVVAAGSAATKAPEATGTPASATSGEAPSK
jgi:hypothetical protein